MYICCVILRFSCNSKTTVESWGSVFFMKDYNCSCPFCSWWFMAVHYTFNQTFLGFCAPSSQMRVKDWIYSFFTQKNFKINNKWPWLNLVYVRKNIYTWKILPLGVGQRQWPGRFLGITGWNPSVCKSNRLHVHILQFSVLNWRIFNIFL